MPVVSASLVDGCWILEDWVKHVSTYWFDGNCSEGNGDNRIPGDGSDDDASRCDESAVAMDQ